ncbi:general stress protein [Pseudomonas corrugata]|uniref:General stress protein n=1 Tax=Pseudomonas corrugata TaxID=47879 RepID=A0A7Y6DGB5_9PSED|nr:MULTISPECIES: general stress protein [Pseudomonas]MCI0996251.1 general stress protein [Pseudomonas corrugata]NUT69342.1 general stress protein [Pseudomonas corrugata]NUT86337.1 general stress protein [Pseudomonas corrugata]TNF80037.1 general stress protein [Pseudomonas sp. ICMP22404]
MANSGNKNPGNFANDREKASEAGKKGGQASGGSNTNDRQKGSGAGSKGSERGQSGAGRKS